MDREQQVTLKLRALGREDLQRLGAEIRGLGPEFTKLANDVDRAAKKSGSGLKAVNQTSKELQSSLEGVADRAGPAGRILGELGPKGKAAAVGLGAVTIALGAVLTVARQAVSAFAEIGAQADVLQLTTERFQVLRQAAQDAGVEFGTVDGGVRTLSEGLAELSRGEGALFDALQQSNPALLRRLQAARNLDEATNILTAALAREENQTRRNQLAIAAFGSAGQDLQTVLGRAEGDLESFTEAQREAGRVIEDDVIRNAQDMEVVLGNAAKVIDRELKRALVGLGPTLVGLVALVGKLLDGLNFLGDQAERLLKLAPGAETRVEVDGLADERDRNVEQRNALETVRRRFDDPVGRIAPFGGVTAPDLFGNDIAARDLFDGLVSSNSARIDALGLETTEEILDFLIERLETRIQERTEDVGRALRSQPAATGESNDLARQLGASALFQSFRFDGGDASGGNSGAANERLRLERQAAELLLDQNDITLALKLERAEINALLEAGLLTTEQAREAQRQAFADLTSSIPAYDRWADSAERWRDAIREGGAFAQRAAGSLANAQGQRIAQEQALADSIRANFTTPEERRAGDLSDIRDLRASANRGEIEFDVEAERRAIQGIEEDYQRAREAASDFLGTQYALEDSLYALVTPADDFDQAWRRALSSFTSELFGVDQMIREAARGLRSYLDEALGSFGGIAGITGMIGNGIGGLFGFGGGGSAVSSFGSGVQSSASTFAAAFHEGTDAGPRSFRRLGGRMSPDEYFAVLQKGETVVPRGESGRSSGPGLVIGRIDATGADPVAIERLIRELDDLRRTFASYAGGERQRVVGHIASERAERGGI